MKPGIFFLSLMIIFIGQQVNAQARRYDSSLKVGKAGFRILCSNKSAERNTVTVNPIGFESAAREVSIEVKGRIVKGEVDDLNNDGFPDLVLYVYSSGTKNTGTVVGISSDKNERFVPIFFPDLMDDPKLRTGYWGNDEFSLVEGSLMRRFPVYTTTDTANIKPTGMMRQIQYRATVTEKGAQKFKVMRSYETAIKQ